MSRTETISTAHAREGSPASAGAARGRRECLAVVLVAAAVLLPRLGARSLADWDEAIYAQVAREMLERGDFLVPHHGGSPFFEKPPLYFWFTVVCYLVAGVTELGARLGSALSGIGVAAVVASLGFALGGRWVGTVAPVVLLTSAGFVLSSRSGMLDVPLTLATWLAVVAFLRFRSGSPRHAYLVAVAAAAAVMLKSVAGLIAPAGLALALWLDRGGRDQRRSAALRRAAALGLALAAPWPLWMLARYGQPFVDSFWGRHVVTRALEPLGPHGGGVGFYLYVLPTMLGAWVWLVPVASLLAVRRGLRDRQVGLPILLVAGVAAAAVFGVRTRIAWYLLPLLPATALFIAAAIDEGVRARRLTILGTLLLSSLVPVALAQGAVRALAAGVLAVALGAAGRWGRRAVALGIVAALSLVSLPALRSTYSGFRHPVAELAAAVERQSPEETSPLVLYAGSPPNLALESREPSALFYARRPVRTAYRREELTAALAAGARFALLPEAGAGDPPAGFEWEVVARDRGLIAVAARRSPADR